MFHIGDDKKNIPDGQERNIEPAKPLPNLPKRRTHRELLLRHPIAHRPIARIAPKERFAPDDALLLLRRPEHLLDGPARPERARGEEAVAERASRVVLRGRAGEVHRGAAGQREAARLPPVEHVGLCGGRAECVQRRGGAGWREEVWWVREREQRAECGGVEAGSNQRVVRGGLGGAYWSKWSCCREVSDREGGATNVGTY